MKDRFFMKRIGMIKNRVYPAVLLFLLLSCLEFLPILLPLKGAYPAFLLFLFSGLVLRNPVLALFFGFSALGDVMGIKGDFPLQILSFSLAQAFMIFLNRRAFLCPEKGCWRRVAVLLVSSLLLGLILWIALRIPSRPLLLLILVYGILLWAMMASSVLGLNALGAAGGILFVVSDAMIGIGRFLWEIPSGGTMVMVTYYAALLLLFMALVRPGWTSPRASF